jgi:hypothetical protein
VEHVLGSVEDAVIEIVPIFDPEMANLNGKPPISQQLVHRDSKDPTKENFLIPLVDGYVVRFFDDDQKRALLVVPQPGQYVRFSTELHQGL